MASRSRSRAFALQLLYCADIHMDGLSSKLGAAQKKYVSTGKVASTSLDELKFIQKIEFVDQSQWDEIRKESARRAFVKHIDESALSLYQSQLELPEEWYHEQRLHDEKDVQQYKILLQENIEPMDAFRIVTDPDLSNLFHFFCKQTLEMLDNPEDFTPSVVAHWLLRESQFDELIDLEIEWTPLYEILCLLQNGSITTQSARILLKRIRKEYDPNNKEIKRTVAELAEGKKGKTLLLLRGVRQSLQFEPDSLLNSNRYPAEPEEIAYTDLLVRGVSQNIAHIDSLISAASRTWEIERMSVIDRNILRLGCYELGYQESVPSRVVINESINLTKNFSGTSEARTPKRSKGYSDGVKFVNGILDRIARELGKKDLAKKKH